ncbi:hypothetical protein MH131_18875, partial [Bacillus safensis]|nr:hypothetical protein [Bacillus safensis]
MDTGTHVVMGISLGGLALLDPAVSADPHMAHAVMIATIAGSQAPDISNTIPSFKKPAAQNAARTILMMGGLLAVLFVGVTLLAF